MLHPNSGAQSTLPSPVIVDDIDRRLTASLLAMAAEALPPHPGDRFFIKNEDLEIALTFLRKHGVYEDGAAVAHLALAAARRGATKVSMADVGRVLADSPSYHVRQRIRGLIPLI